MKNMEFRHWLIFLFRATAFVHGILCGAAIVVPIILNAVTSNLLPFLMLPVLFVASNFICGGWAAKKLNSLNEILYTELEPERFLERFTKEVYSKKPNDWNGLVVVLAAQAYHAQGRFKEEESLYLRCLKEGGKLLMPESMDEGDYAMLGRLVILYSDAGNADGVKKAFAKAQKLETILSRRVNDEAFNAAIKNCYLKGVGEYDECVEYFEHCAASSPNKLTEMQSRFRLAEVYAGLGKNEEAQEEYRIVADNGKNLYIAHEAAQRLVQKQ